LLTNIIAENYRVAITLPLQLRNSQNFVNASMDNAYNK